MQSLQENVITVASTDRATFDEETFRFEITTASKEVRRLVIGVRLSPNCAQLGAAIGASSQLTIFFR